jgi:hypothetical protein
MVWGEKHDKAVTVTMYATLWRSNSPTILSFSQCEPESHEFLQDQCTSAVAIIAQVYHPTERETLVVPGCQCSA